jgi:hypothetical protein
MGFTYDAGCYSLAKSFLEDCGHKLTPEMLVHHADMLALDIQRLIEDYLDGIGK